MALSALLAALIVGCSGVPAAPSPVQAAFRTLIASGFNCSPTGSSSDPGGYGQWTCRRTLADGTVDSALVDGDDRLVKQVLATHDVSASSTGSPDALDFFTLVASIDLGAPPADVTAWIASHDASGGQGTVGPILITLDVRPRARTLVLFVRS